MKKILVLSALFAFAACKESTPAEKPAEAKATAAAKPAPKKPASQPKKAPKAKKPGESAATRDHVDDDGIVRRGNELSAKETVSVAIALAKLSEMDGKYVKVTGKVGKVCEKKGCWFVLEEGGSKIRITAKDYKFFVPQNSIGMIATVEGDMKVETLSKKDAEHLAAEGASVKGAEKEITIMAHGIEMKKAG